MNGYELHARSLKVARILALVPAGANAHQNEALADCLRSFSAADRQRFAAAAGASKPSDATWSALVAAVLVRGRS